MQHDYQIGTEELARLIMVARFPKMKPRLRERYLDGFPPELMEIANAIVDDAFPASDRARRAALSIKKAVEAGIFNP